MISARCLNGYIFAWLSPFSLPIRFFELNSDTRLGLLLWSLRRRISTKLILRGFGSIVLVMVSTVFSTMVGGLVGGSVSRVLNDPIWISWKSLGIPPEKPIKITDGDIWGVVILSSSGKLFEFTPTEMEWRTGLVSGYWVSSSSPKLKGKDSQCTVRPMNYRKPPGKVTDFYETRWCYEIVVSTKYVILEDGSVWRWNTRDGRPIVFYCVAVGLGLGFLTGPTIVALYFVRRNLKGGGKE
jgi:hypothetical protein